MHKVYLSLGSNMGQKVDYLDKAVEKLSNHRFIHKLNKSSYYSTDPVGYIEQDTFVNIAVEIETTMKPYELLNICQQIELELDRVRIVRWGPRTVDIDIILYDDIKMTDEALTLPHPRMKERGFVLIPIEELVPELMIDGQAIKTWIARIPSGGVRKMIWTEEY